MSKNDTPTEPVPEQWDETDGAVEAECSYCGKTRPCIWTPDPYVAELSPEDNPEPEWWCYPCFSARKDDI